MLAHCSWDDEGNAGEGVAARMTAIHAFRKDCPNDYTNYFRLPEEDFIVLLAKVELLIMVEQDSVMRNAITPQPLLAATVHFVATGRSFQDLLFHVKPWA
ncbi:hypothetical protein PR048_033124 [Dryococelus australis]|uniref:Uncharacterized protein n=1 Tax=Dryococelus australis TaxID=614101 RepID=A0ABQ9G3L3_9NEOP|nr:hypothetical protein PR048_033124 [Dryococelus australis]